MDEAIKQEWVAALRSGEYTQGIAVLSGKEGKDCCLGVLCKLAVKHSVIVPPTEYGRCFVYGYKMDSAILPDEVCDWAKISADGYLQEPFNSKYTGGNISALTSANDDGYSFNEIADIIEAQF